MSSSIQQHHFKWRLTMCKTRVVFTTGIAELAAVLTSFSTGINAVSLAWGVTEKWPAHVYVSIPFPIFTPWFPWIMVGPAAVILLESYYHHWSLTRLQTCEVPIVIEREIFFLLWFNCCFGSLNLPKTHQIWNKHHIRWKNLILNTTVYALTQYHLHALKMKSYGSLSTASYQVGVMVETIYFFRHEASTDFNIQFPIYTKLHIHVDGVTPNTSQHQY